MIAQEFAQVVPEFVRGSGEKLPDGSEILKVDPYPLTIYSAAAVQELSRIVKAKDGRIRAPEDRLARLATTVQHLAATRNAALEAGQANESAPAPLDPPAAGTGLPAVEPPGELNAARRRRKKGDRRRSEIRAERESRRRRVSPPARSR